jgi:hypothetical protein
MVATQFWPWTDQPELAAAPYLDAPHVQACLQTAHGDPMRPRKETVAVLRLAGVADDVAEMGGEAPCPFAPLRYAAEESE